MKSISKKVSYKNTNTYETLNELTPKTKNVWMVFHGIGYLSRYFLRYFDGLPADENYIIAPQAPSKYYLNNTYTHVGASWLTKIDTEQETENVLTYVNEVWRNEKPKDAKISLIVMGFSQGVSIATRWLAQEQLPCKTLLLYAGGLPKELKTSDFDHLIKNNTKIISIIGDKDAYLTPERLKNERERLAVLFKGKAQHITFHGGHEIKKEILNKIVYGS
jgi:predicted esterase